MDPPVAQDDNKLNITQINEDQLAKTLMQIRDDDIIAMTRSQPKSTYVAQIIEHGKNREIMLLLAVAAAVNNFIRKNKHSDEAFFNALCAYYEKFKTTGKDRNKIIALLNMMSDHNDIKNIYTKLVEDDSHFAVKPSNRTWNLFKSTGKETDKLLINDRDRQNSSCGQFAQAMIIVCHKYYEQIKLLPIRKN
jgi:hypothetical protein